MPFSHLNIFSGSGGFELAAEAVGWENVASCEINRYARQLIQLRFPGHTVHKDATDTDWGKYRYAIDVLTMSPPCQPHSSMGKRLASDDDRDLLHICPGILDQIRPQACVLENVSGLITSESGMALWTLIRAMESAGHGYTVLPLLVAAGSTGALHLRNRLWLVAHANQKRRKPGSISSISSPSGPGPNAQYRLNPYAERIRAAGQAPFLGIYDGLPGALDERPGQKIRLMGNAVAPAVVIPIFQAIDAGLRT